MKPKKWTSWRVCPNCGSRATKILNATAAPGKTITCQICNHKYDQPGTTVKITVSVDGPSCQGIGKSTVTAIIMESLTKFGYDVTLSVIPCADNPVTINSDSAIALMKHEQRVIKDIIDHNKMLLDPSLSTPKAIVNLIEHT